MARPSPVPPYLRVVEESAWTNGSNSRCRWFGSIPTPVSLTSNRTVAASAVAFPLYYRVLRTIGPAKAAYSSVLVPVVAMLLSTLFEGYRWSPLAGAGAGLVGAAAVAAGAAGLLGRLPPGS